MRTRRVDLSRPGISRQRCGRGFSYKWPSGVRVDELEVLERIQKLAVPPAWKDVWICVLANGHIQATGTDAAGRRQYRYHDDWRRRRDAEKFARLQDFGVALPGLRHQVIGDLQQEGFGQRRVVAAAVRLLDLGAFRIGGEQYAEEHETYGVATLLKQHVSRKGSLLVFDYDAKGSRRRTVAVHDELLVPIVTSLKRRRTGGDELLAWKNQQHWVKVRSSDINDYIKAAAGDGFSAKDFRTWSATVLAAVGMAVEELAGARANRATINRVIRQVADIIGDTPAVCRSSYIDPAVVDRFAAGTTIAAAVEQLSIQGDLETWGHRAGLSAQQAVEEAVLEMLDYA